MTTDFLTAALLVAAAVAFVIIGFRMAGRERYPLDDYLAARNAYGARAGAATLLASSFGAWLLFGPPEAATRGGTVALLGYGLGSAAPRLAMIPLASRLRRLMPYGRGLSDYIHLRYGAYFYIAVLTIMAAYLVVVIAAEATATAKVIAAVSDLPAWLPAAVTLVASLVYTGVGGLHASIVTDRAQMRVIVPFLLALIGIGAYVLVSGEGAGSTLPPLIGADWPALETAIALFLAILFTNVLHQGNWQRVFAMRDQRALRRSLLGAACLSAPVVALVGGFGILHAWLGLQEPSAAVFAVLRTVLPGWALSAAAVLAVALVLSSMDTALNALMSLTVVAMRSARPAWHRRRLLRLALAIAIGAAVIALFVAVQGWSVLYLFLCADLLCASAAIPVFAGLYLPRYDAPLAGASLALGLIGAFSLFPGPSLAGGSLAGAFALAAGIPLALTPVSLLAGTRFDLSRLAREVTAYPD